MVKENNNLNNSIELRFIGATLKLTNYDPKQFYCIIGFLVFLVIAAKV